MRRAGKASTAEVCGLPVSPASRGPLCCREVRQDHCPVVTAAEVPHLLTGMKVEVNHHFSAPVAAVWELLSDVERMAGVGPEHVAACWTGDERGLGARFDGTNKSEDMEWTVPCFVIDCQPPHRFAWAVVDAETPSSVWSYNLRETPTGTHVTQRFEHGPNYSFTRLWAEQNPEEAE